MIVAPVTRGNGKRLFPETEKRITFQLTFSEVFPSGAVALRYTIKPS